MFESNICYIAAYKISYSVAKNPRTSVELKRGQSIKQENLPSELAIPLREAIELCDVRYIALLKSGRIRVDLGAHPKTSLEREIDHGIVNRELEYPFVASIHEYPGRYSRYTLITSPGQNEVISICTKFRARTSWVLSLAFRPSQGWV